MVTLFLVRHGRPLLRRGVPAAEWELDPAGFDACWSLRDRLPVGAVWCSSSEPKALQTARLLTDGQVAIVPALGEHRRGATWVEDFDGVVTRAFRRPRESALDGWEPLDRWRTRVVGATAALVAEHPDRDLVLVGHGTAWTLVSAALTGVAPDLDRWRTLGMPDVIEVPHVASRGGCGRIGPS